MAENKLAELSMDSAVEVLKMCNNLFKHKPILPSVINLVSFFTCKNIPRNSLDFSQIFDCIKQFFGIRSQSIIAFCGKNHFVNLFHGDFRLAKTNV